MLFSNNDRIVFTGDSTTDAGRKRPYGEGLWEGVGNGYVRTLDSLLKTVYPEQTFRIANTGSSGFTSRALLEKGDVRRATKMLGRPYTLSAPVLHGHALGRTLGLPTINQAFPEGAQVPKNGVYVTKVYIDNKAYIGLTNVGTRPTVGGVGVNSETHILDFEGDLYGKTVRVAFIDYLREEIKFVTPDALRAQVQKDIREVKTRDEYRMD